MNMGFGCGWVYLIYKYGYLFYVLKMGYLVYNNIMGKLIVENFDIDCRGGVRYSKLFCNIVIWVYWCWLNGNVFDLVFKNLLWKDIFIILSDCYVVIRIKVDNFGLWLMYCYIEFYVINGMVMILNEFFIKLFRMLINFLICRDFKNED